MDHRVDYTNKDDDIVERRLLTTGEQQAMSISDDKITELAAAVTQQRARQ